MTTQSYTSRNGTDAVVNDLTGEIIGPENVSEWAEYQNWLKDGNVTNPPELLPIFPPASIGRRQFYQQGALAGIFDRQESLAAIKTGALPASVVSYVESLDDPDENFAAEMIFSGASVLQRKSPTVEGFLLSIGLSSRQIDEFFVAAEGL